MRQAQTHGELLIQAREGDEQAWERLVEQMSPIVWSVVRSFRLDRATAQDVTQAVWLKLIENCDRIVDPNRLPGWISTTCRREAMAAKSRSDRVTPSDFDLDVEDDCEPIEFGLIRDEEHQEIRDAFDRLDESDQQLLRLLILDPPLSYQQISDLTGRPVGSIGPTRSRVLIKLRREMNQVAVVA